MPDDRPADARGFATLDRRIALEFDRYVAPIGDPTPSAVIAEAAMARRRGILTWLRLAGLPVPGSALRLAVLVILLLAAALAVALLAGHRPAPAVFLGRVAFPVENGDGTESVAVVDGTGMHVSGRRVPDYALACPAWSPDGTRLAWGEGGTLVIDDGAGETRQIDAGGSQLAWSPDSARIASFDAQTDQLRVVEVATGRISALGAWDGMALRPWSPDGSHLLAFATRDGTPMLVEVTVPPGTSRAIGPADGSWPHDAAWSPDGQAVAFVKDGRLLVAPPVGSGAPRPVSAAGQDVIGLAWSADGSRLAYTTSATGQIFDAHDLWVVGRDGVGRELVATLGAGAFVGPATWAADGSSLVIAVRTARDAHRHYQVTLVRLDGSSPVVLSDFVGDGPTTSIVDCPLAWDEVAR